MKDSEIRKHYFLDEYVIISPKRNQRPHRAVRKAEDVSPEACYFCKPQVDDPKEQYQLEDIGGRGKKDWLVKVIYNKYPALTESNLKAYGRQEIIVETPQHNVEIQELSLEHIKLVFDTYIERYKAINSLPGVCYTLIFKNEGGKAGASIPHAHSQIIGLPMIPPKIQKEAAAIDDYITKNKSCPYCDVLKSEAGSRRVIWEDDYLFVLAPYASESPYGAWFIPKRHVHSIEYLHETEKTSLARSFKAILSRLDEIDMPYNYFVQNSLDCESHHMILKLSPRPNIWAGLELGTGIIINPVTPEDAAKFYREGPVKE